MRLCRFERGEIVFWEADECAGLHMIRTGSVKLFKVSPHGRELVVKVLEESATFNEVPVFDNGTNPINVAALEDCEIWIIEAGLLQDCLYRYPEMAQSVILNLSQNLRNLLKIVEELSFFQVTNRMARLISQLPSEQLVGEREDRLTQDELAARLGTVREVVARALRELERSGAIQVQRRQIAWQMKILREWAQDPNVRLSESGLRRYQLEWSVILPVSAGGRLVNPAAASGFLQTQSRIEFRYRLDHGFPFMKHSRNGFKSLTLDQQRHVPSIGQIDPPAA
jgi:CRP/FNR family transcriptional regulator